MSTYPELQRSFMKIYRLKRMPSRDRLSAASASACRLALTCNDAWGLARGCCKEGVERHRGGFSDETFYKWRAKFGGLQVSAAHRLRELEPENAKFKRLQAEALLETRPPKSVLGVMRLTPRFRTPRVPSCGPSRDSYLHQPKADQVTLDLHVKIVEIAHVRHCFGYRRIHDLFSPQFPVVNHMRAYRFYRQALAARRRKKSKQPINDALSLGATMAPPIPKLLG